MTYEEAKPFTDKLYELAMWYHAKPNEFRKRVYEVIEEIAQAEREACAKVVDHILKEGGGTYGDAIRARDKT
jgi:hypothetical protein